ncbi:hypothetical protein [Rhizobium sp. WYCCWR 11146]|uniref:hypothetical protein n=1 Tax=Rhizobium sp. WYCCWR 11146 TaxID=2749833 RepID=UPI0015E730F9|nr:hypothetical protein [Rhizobium sp. WYCCWR 11146]MBA1343893.1 hypothetical protein [Rhizobium sp. WYCCWR 11146]
MTELNLAQQMLMAKKGVSTSDRAKINAYLSTLRGRSPYDTFPKAADHLAVIDRDGEGAMERMGIPTALRVGAILETRCGGGGYMGSFGVLAIWRRTEIDWQLVSAERQRFFGRRNGETGFLTLTPEQLEFRNDRAARKAYADHVRRFGEND